MFRTVTGRRSNCGRRARWPPGAAPVAAVAIESAAIIVILMVGFFSEHVRGLEGAGDGGGSYWLPAVVAGHPSLRRNALANSCRILAGLGSAWQTSAESVDPTTEAAPTDHNNVSSRGPVTTVGVVARLNDSIARNTRQAAISAAATAQPTRRARRYPPEPAGTATIHVSGLLTPL